MSQFGKFEFKKVSSGLVQVPTHFQQLINEVLKGLPFAFGHLDDILVFSENNEKHLNYLRIVFDGLGAAYLKFKRTKCDFFNCELNYLGHLIAGKGIYPLPEKLQSIKNLPVSKLPKEVRQMFGFTGYY